MKVITYLTAFLLLVNFGFAQDEDKEPEMILIEGGILNMGNDYSENKDERPEHKVSINGFYISKYETTAGEYTKFCKVVGKKPPTAKNPRFPVTSVNWQDAVMYCNWLSNKYDYERCYKIFRDSSKFRVVFDKTKNGFRLPSEAEWEFAAKGGNKTKHYPFSGGYKTADVSWNNLNSVHIEREVGTKKPNELGIYDMTGNCMEWCWDWYKNDYYKEFEDKPADNPWGPPSGIRKVSRGGHRMCKDDMLRVTRRFNLEKDDNAGLTGIRLARNM